MDCTQPTPLFFANKVIHRLVDNLLGCEIDGKQVETIRVVFRRCGGEWTRIVSGDPVHIGLLIKLVQAWGRTRQKQPKPHPDEAYEHDA